MVAPARAMPATYAFGVLVLLGGTSGCLTPEKPPAASADLKTMQCETQRITGSLVATRVCTLQFQRDKIHQDVRDAVDFINGEKIGPCPGPGCN